MSAQTFNLPNYRAFDLKYLGPTNNRGSRVKISDPRFEKSKIIPYNHEFNNIGDMALDYLQRIGFEIVGQIDNTILFTSDFRTELK